MKGENAEIRDLGLIAPDIAGQRAVGSLIGGLNYGILSGCYTEGGSVSGDLYVGGLVGYNYQGTITSSFCTGEVTGIGPVGRLVVGGLVGWNNTESNSMRAAIMNCYATGSVSGSRYVGGLVGNNGRSLVANCYST